MQKSVLNKIIYEHVKQLTRQPITRTKTIFKTESLNYQVLQPKHEKETQQRVTEESGAVHKQETWPIRVMS